MKCIELSLAHSPHLVGLYFKVPLSGWTIHTQNMVKSTKERGSQIVLVVLGGLGSLEN
jgi:hypothetical protein